MPKAKVKRAPSGLDNNVFNGFMRRFGWFALKTAHGCGESRSKLPSIRSYGTYIWKAVQYREPDRLIDALTFSLAWYIEKAEGIGVVEITRRAPQYLEDVMKFYHRERETIAELFLEVS